MDRYVVVFDMCKAGKLQVNSVKTARLTLTASHHESFVNADIGCAVARCVRGTFGVDKNCFCQLVNSRYVALQAKPTPTVVALQRCPWPETLAAHGTLVPGAREGAWEERSGEVGCDCAC